MPKMFYGNTIMQRTFYNKLNQMLKKKILKKGQAPDEWHTQLYDRITKIEVEVLERIQKQKASNKSYLCEHFNIDTPECQPYDSNVNYYDKFWKRFLLNEIGKQNVARFKENLQIFKNRLEKIDNLFEQWQKEVGTLKKTKQGQQKGQERQKQICPHCRRSYKDQQTLMIHIKIKHNEEKSSVKKQKIEEVIFQEDND